jgi:hypothetical protein
MSWFYRKFLLIIAWILALPNGKNREFWLIMTLKTPKLRSQYGKSLFLKKIEKNTCA